MKSESGSTTTGTRACRLCLKDCVALRNFNKDAGQVPDKLSFSTCSFPLTLKIDFMKGK